MLTRARGPATSKRQNKTFDTKNRPTTKGGQKHHFFLLQSPCRKRFTKQPTENRSRFPRSVFLVFIGKASPEAHQGAP
jgi:hypothetical protein